MDNDEYADEAIFDDLYDDEPTAPSQKAAPAVPKTNPQTEQKPAAPAISVESTPVVKSQNEITSTDMQQSYSSGNADYSGYNIDTSSQGYNDYNQGQNYGNMDANGWNQEQQNNYYGQGQYGDGQNSGDMHEHGGSGDGGNNTAIKEDGKMFIGGLNWETTDESLRDYFSQFGEVSECTVMRDGPSGRSRGFGFLTFKDPKTVNIVMVKEHYLDGKIIDPKRAIPRDEQERTSKIFVGGVSQDATEQDFREYFMQFGRVIDSTLMIDKETGRPRGFGFVTFDSESAVDAALAHPDLRIHDKPIEVKKAQPRGNARDRNFDEEGGNNRQGNFRDRGHHNNRFNQNQNQSQGQGSQDNGNFSNPQNNTQNNMQNPMNPAGANPAASFTNGMSPAMLAQYWQRMQQYWMMMMQQQAQMMRPGATPQANMMPNGPNGPMGNFNPAMMAQMAQMQNMPGGMNPMGMNGMPQMGNPGQGMGQGGNQGFNQQGFQPKSPNMQMQQPYSAGEGSGDGSQQDQKSGIPFTHQDRNFNTPPTGPKGGTGGPPPNAPTGPRNARTAPSGPSGGSQGPYRGAGRAGYGGHGRGFHPYQRS